ncbi:MAG: NAD(P)H-hydrate dehydratase [Clostridia bacterium]|nr:NAD(P)H-hydrate dehydratase [Clostridia bacterium]
MKQVISVATMRHSDAETIRAGISGRELMYRAGQAIMEAYPWRGRTAIVCGSGNNAGDGYVLALLMRERGISCTLVRLTDKLSADGAYYYEKCVQQGIESCRFTSDFDFSPYEEIADCMLGTGFSGTVEGIYAEAIELINASGKTVISVDINSGLNGDNGLGECAVRSDLTLSIGYYQFGHFLGTAKDRMKEKKNLDIGIDLYGRCAELAEASDLTSLLERRAQVSHKGNYGYVALLGGCREYAGAAKLANMSCAALRSGCGVVTLAVPNSIADSVSPYLLESTLCPMPDENGHILPNFDAIDRLLANRRALAIGMGWGRSAHNAKILEHILTNHALSVVIDADGLNTLAEMDREILETTKCQVLLTPHLKEFSRLCGKEMAEILTDPVGAAEEYAKMTGVCLLLKGACTVVTDGEKTLLVDRGCAGMATAGSGDVLSGVLAGLLGYLPLTTQTAACGAYLAGLAGELAERELNDIGMLASDTVRHLPQAINIIRNGDPK